MLKIFAFVLILLLLLIGKIKFLAIFCLFGEIMQVIAVNPKYNIQYDAPQEVTLRDPDTICADAGEIGNFPIGDDTCARYVICYKVDKTLSDIKGLFMMCHAQRYFDPVQSSCTNIRPINCKTTEEPKTTTRTPPRDADTICADAGVVGNFPTEDDTTCTEFIVCYKPNKDQDIFKALPLQKCPSSPEQHYFDPISATCTTVKPAECATITTAEPTTTVSTPPRDADTICADAGVVGIFPNEDDTTCTEFIVCYKPNQDEDIFKAFPPQKCPSSPEQLYFNPISATCTFVKPAECATITTVEPTTTVSTPPRDANTICADAGRVGKFPTEDDTTCTKFIVCYKPNKDQDIFKAIPNIKCRSSPEQHYFDPISATCTTVKPAECATITTAEPTTTVSTPPCDADTICADAGVVGNFPTEDDTCTQFIYCYKPNPNLQDIKGLLIKCASVSTQFYFDPVLGLCTDIKPKNCPTIEEPTTTVKSPPRDANTICADAGVVGLFPTEDDTTCTKFIVCYKPNKDQNIFKAIPNNKCPTNPVQQYFDPVRATCTTIKPAGCT